MAAILMRSWKLATQGVLKIKAFWSKGFDVTISANDVTNKIFLRDSNYIVDVVMLPKFGNSSISMKEVIWSQFCKDWPEKPFFLREVLLIIWVWH